MQMNNRALGNRIEDYKRAIEDYWRTYLGKGLYSPDRWHEYFDRHLPEELSIAKSIELEEKQIRVSPEPRQILILLVGFAFEPLFQAICAWKPACKVLFIMNQNYSKESGRELGRFLCKELVQYLKQNLDFELEKTLQADFEVLPSATPPDVFRVLREKAIDLVNKYGHDQVVLDITGGKKSMVAGAYLFGAYADVDISYVDFDDDAWCSEYSRPYGYACQIGIIENPYKLFALREWQKVEELYNNYSFRSAFQLVENLKTDMGEYLSPAEPVISRLQNMLEMYEAYENGDFVGALKKFKEVEPKLLHEKKSKSPEGKLKSQETLKLPTALTTLGENEWPFVDPTQNAQVACESLLGKRVGNNPRKGGSIDSLQFGTETKLSLYLRSDLLITYAIDEMRKVRHLIYNKEDYRSALLRSASLSEVLLRGRLMILLYHKELYYKQPFPSELETKKALVRLALFEARNILKELNVNEKKLIRNSQKVRITSDTSLWKTEEMIEADLAELRNSAIHFCLSITPGLAKAGLNIAFQNFRDYYKHWAKFGIQQPNLKIYQHYQTRIPWDDLCAICGIQFLPKKRRYEK